MQCGDPSDLVQIPTIYSSRQMLHDEDLRMLSAMRHGLMSCVSPELSSEMAQTICTFSVEYLDKLIAKYTAWPVLLRQQNDQQAKVCREMQQLLQQAGNDPDGCDQELTLIDQQIACQANLSLEELEKLQHRINGLLEKMVPHLFKDGPIQEGGQERRDALLRDLIESVKSSETSCIEAIEDRVEAHLNLVQNKVVVTREKMQSYLEDRFPERGSIKITSFLELPGGSSKSTILMDVKGFESDDVTPLVVRLDREAGSTDTHVLDEVPTLRAMRTLGLPVPELLWEEPDTSKVGLAFIVVGKIDASLGGGMWNADKTLCDEETALDLARLLAKLHNLDVDKHGLRGALNSDPDQHPMRGLIDNIRSLWRMKKMQPDGVLEACLCWLEQNMPAALEKPALIHADVSSHNIMVKDGKVACLLDWELSHLGDPNEDLSYCRPCVEQLIPWDDFMAEYRKHGGVEYSEEAGKYYAIWRNVRNLVYTVTSGHSFHSGANPDFRWGYFYTYYRMVLLDAADNVAQAGTLSIKQEKKS